MNHKFLILHFGGQCPWYPWVVEQARTAAGTLGSVEAVDVSRPGPGADLARSHCLYFPFLTVIDDSVKVWAPVPAETLLKLTSAKPPETPVPAERPPSRGRADRVEQLTTANLAHTFPLCNAPRGCGGADAKSLWASETAAHVPLGVLGYIAYAEDPTYPNGRAVAAVEFLPSTLIPYPIPRKDERAAFITCIYPTKEPDYRHDVLWRLLADLPSYGYSRVLAIAGRNTPFPNGPVSFFKEHGFTEVQVLDTEQLPDGIEELALMEISCQR